MKQAWDTLKKRDTYRHGSLGVWTYCQKAVYLWRGLERLSPTQRKNKFQKINETAKNLRRLLFDTYEFDDFNVSSMFDYKNMKKDMTEKISNKDFEHMSFAMLLYIHSPGIGQILENISLKSEEYLNIIPLVNQPKSNRAHIHYFVRSLSNDIYEYYNEPLHNVVAIITSLILNTEIDENHVSKIVNSYRKKTD